MTQFTGNATTAFHLNEANKIEKMRLEYCSKQLACI